ncbi:hypothetical protein D3C79_610100 [compost metagenome]
MLDQPLDDAAGGVHPEIRRQQLGLQLLEQLIIDLLATEQAEEAGPYVFSGAHQAALEASEEALPLRLVLGVVVNLGGQRQAGQGGGIGSLSLSGNTRGFRGLNLGGDTRFFRGLSLGSDACGFRGLSLGGDARLFCGLSLGYDACLFCGLNLGYDACLFCGLNLGGDACLLCGLRLGGNTRGFRGLDLGGNTRLFLGDRIGDQCLIDDDGLEFGGRLLHHQRAFVGRRQRRLMLYSRGLGQGNISDGSGGSSGLGLGDSRGGCGGL